MKSLLTAEHEKSNPNKTSPKPTQKVDLTDEKDDADLLGISDGNYLKPKIESDI